MWIKRRGRFLGFVNRRRCGCHTAWTVLTNSRIVTHRGHRSADARVVDSRLVGITTAGIARPNGRVSPPMRKRIVAGALAAGITLAACGGEAEPPVAEDGTVITLPEPEPGPVPALPVAAESVTGSPLPEIAVRRINGEGGWVQFRNELPAEQPLLVWFWAPH